MPSNKWIRLPGGSPVTMFIWCAMALPFLLALTGLLLAIRIIGEAGSSALVSDTATLALMFIVGVVSALLATWYHSR